MSDWSFYDRGLSLFPLTPRTKRPAVEWESYQTTRAAPAQVAAWRQHHWNTGVATGAVSGCIVLDADSLLARIETERRGVPVTLTISTPRGTHWYFQHPGWNVSNRAGPSWTKLHDTDEPVSGWDLRGDGGYVVGPGSYFVPTEDERAKGKVEGGYTVETDASIAQAPDWLLELIFPKTHKPTAPSKTTDVTTPYGRAALHDEVGKLIGAMDGEVNNTINLCAFAIGQLVAGGEIEQQEGWGALWEALEARGIADDGKSPGTLERGWAAGLLVPRAHEDVTPEAVLGTRSPGIAPHPTGPVAPPPPGSPVVVAERAYGPATIPQYVGGLQADEYFEGCVYVSDRDQIFTPMGVMFKKSPFDAVYGGPEFVMDFAGSKKVRSAWEFFRENSQVPMPKAQGCFFRPELPSGQIVRHEGLPYLNTYVPIPVKRMAGDASPFVGHVRKMLPAGQDADILLHYMASMVQNPGRKFQWWPVVQGVKGNGKSLLLDCVIAAVGERYSHKVRADAVMKTGNQFNEWIENKLFLGFEEIRTSEGRRDFVELMKDSVTAKRIGTEGKGKSQGTSDNRANGIMLTNHADAVPIDDDERRWCILYCAQQSFEDLMRDGMNGEYFRNLYAWLEAGGFAIVTDYLLTFPLAAALDPAQWLQRSPETTSTPAAIEASLGPLEQEVQEAVAGELHGFRGGVVTSLALRNLFDRLRKSVGPRRWLGIMEAVGYVHHPAMVGQRGRPNNPLYDGSKPVLYYAKWSPLLKIMDHLELVKATEEILRGGEAATNVIPFNPRR